jgi:hypothetical protein
MLEFSVHYSARNFSILAVSFGLITVMKFSILGAVLKGIDIMQSTKPKIEPLDCKEFF